MRIDFPLWHMLRAQVASLRHCMHALRRLVMGQQRHRPAMSEGVGYAIWIVGAE